MPIYEYVPDSGHCDQCGGRFEVIQSVSAPPLTRCEQCDQPCHRVFSTFAVTGPASDRLKPKNLAAKGFTQYKKMGDGYYEKTAGKEGPQVIQRGDG